MTPTPTGGNGGNGGKAGPSTVDRAKEDAVAAVDARMSALVELSRAIHDRPELAFEEEEACAWTADVLADAGFVVERGAAGMETAFVAQAGSGPMVLGICAEYDALPEVGHACGHNLIAASAVGAGIGLLGSADDLGLTVRVIGTPAEEGGGGKIVMLDAGVFDGVHAAMMVHPWPSDWLEGTCLAVSHFDVAFHGRAAHASASPFEGINAADAMVVAQVAIGLLRQQLPPGDQVHGVVTQGGGAANVIPALVTGRFMCRSRTIEGLRALEPRVTACFEAGALASGATYERTDLAPVYSHMVSHPGLLARYRANAERLGRSFDDDKGLPRPSFSTDMANVSLAVPTIHPLVGLDSHGSVNHQPEFAAACVTPSAERALHDGAVSLAWTAIDAAVDEELRAELLRAG
jgi:amidohydrolase